MIKKITILISTLVALLVLNGCQNGGYYDQRDNNANNLTTLFLVDENGFSYGGIPYKCDSMNSWEKTLPNGEFTFLPPDNCEFDFNGLNGTDETDMYKDELVYIVDDLNNGKNNIEYECSRFNVGNVNRTFYDGISNGSFDYDVDDQCVFYL